MPPPQLLLCTFPARSVSLTAAVRKLLTLLLVRSQLLLYANQQTQHQREADWLYHMVHSLLITSSDNSSSSLLMTRGTAVIVMFVGKKESKQWCHVSLSIKRFHILSGIINTLGHIASKFALQAKGCHSPDNYFWKWSQNHSDWQMQQSRDCLGHLWRKNEKTVKCLIYFTIELKLKKLALSCLRWTFGLGQNV